MRRQVAVVGPQGVVIDPRQRVVTGQPQGEPHPVFLAPLISPPGFETFFEEVDVLARQGTPDMGQVVALAGKYGVDLLGPPPG